jgi:hypothetical protein
VASRGFAGLVVVVALIVASCGESAEQGGRGPLDLRESDLAAAEAHFAPLDAEEDGFDALRARRASGDTSTAAVRSFVESAYSPDVVFHDATFGDHSEGYDEVTSMYQTFLFYFDDAVVEDTPTLIGDPTALKVIPFWDMTLGPYEFTQDAPLIEIDLIEVDDNRIRSLLLFYDLASLRRIRGDQPAFDGSLQQAYADAWTSGSGEDVTALYAVDPTRHDGLAGLDLIGTEAIATQADHWWATLPGVTWSVQIAFSERYGKQAGAVFDVIHDGCTVAVGILFDLNDEGLITHEQLHYDPATLRACGWSH